MCKPCRNFSNRALYLANISYSCLTEHILGWFRNVVVCLKKQCNYVSSLYTDNNYKYVDGNNVYVNMGITYITDDSSDSTDLADFQGMIHNNTTADYTLSTSEFSVYSCQVYLEKGSSGSPEKLITPDFESSQYSTLPVFSYDYTEKNYIPKSEENSDFCYYDSTSKSVKVNYTGDTFEWDPMILTATKMGNTLAYTVTMDGTEYNDQKIEFAESGDYIVTYTISDPYNYDKDGNRIDNQEFIREVKLSVTITAPEAIVYHPEFTYVGSWSSYKAKQVTIGNDTYVMPDVTATSSTIGSTTVGGQTIYCPIVTVDGKKYYSKYSVSTSHIKNFASNLFKRDCFKKKSTAKVQTVLRKHTIISVKNKFVF